MFLLKKNRKMIHESIIRKLVDYILLNACSVNSSGLYNGKAGMALALFEAARYLQDEYIEEQAFELLQESLLSKNEDVSFENGLSGIGYVLLYLIENEFIEADFYDLFKEQCEKVIEHFENIDKRPDKLLGGLKIVYFLSAIKKNKYEDLRVNLIIEKIFQGIELYLSIQFFDFKNIHYLNDKTFVLNVFEIYLNLVDCSNYRKFSNSLLNDYAELYRSGRIVSSLTVGFYLHKIMSKDNILRHQDILDNNKNNGIKNININLLSLNESIDIIKLADKWSDCNLLLDINSINERFDQKIKTMIRPSSFISSYQSGLSRYLIFYINKNVALL
nr:lanthionine synthetase LanC family protein [uncultured Bacteroides sp.]